MSVEDRRIDILEAVAVAMRDQFGPLGYGIGEVPCVDDERVFLIKVGETLFHVGFPSSDFVEEAESPFVEGTTWSFDATGHLVPTE